MQFGGNGSTEQESRDGMGKGSIIGWTVGAVIEIIAGQTDRSHVDVRLGIQLVGRIYGPSPVPRLLAANRFERGDAFLSEMGEVSKHRFNETYAATM